MTTKSGVQLRQDNRVIGVGQSHRQSVSAAVRRQVARQKRGHFRIDGANCRAHCQCARPARHRGRILVKFETNRVVAVLVERDHAE